MNESRNIAEIVVSKLSTHLGPHVARIAIKTFAQKAVSRNPDQLTQADVPQLIEALKPMLSVMIGRVPSDVVLQDIARSCNG